MERDIALNEEEEAKMDSALEAWTKNTLDELNIQEHERKALGGLIGLAWYAGLEHGGPILVGALFRKYESQFKTNPSSHDNEEPDRP